MNKEDSQVTLQSQIQIALGAYRGQQQTYLNFCPFFLNSCW